MARKKQNTRVTPRQPVKLPWKLMLWGMVPVLLLAGLLYARHWLNDDAHLKIAYVEIVGDLKHTDRQAIQQIIEPFVNTNLHLLDASALEEELEFEPWIDSVAIIKRWPRDLVVEITEQVPVAFWGDDRLVNYKGEIFDATLPSQKGVMPMLYNPEDKGLEMIRQYKEIQHWFKTEPLGVNAFTVNARGSWKIGLTNGWQVEIGKQQQEKRIRRFLVAYKKELADKADKVRKIDLRYTNGLAVSWK